MYLNQLHNVTKIYICILEIKDLNRSYIFDFEKEMKIKGGTDFCHTHSSNISLSNCQMTIGRYNESQNFMLMLFYPQAQILILRLKLYYEN